MNKYTIILIAAFLSSCVSNLQRPTITASPQLTFTLSPTATNTPTTIPATPTPKPSVYLVNQDGSDKVLEGDDLEVRVLGIDSDLTDLTYHWYRNDTLIVSGIDSILTNDFMHTFTGIPGEMTPASNHLDHAIQGYSFRVDVINSNGTLLGIDEIVVGGLAYPKDWIHGTAIGSFHGEGIKSPHAVDSLQLLLTTDNPNWLSVRNNYIIQNETKTTIYEGVSDSGWATSPPETIGKMIDYTHGQGVKVMYSPVIHSKSGRDKSAIIPGSEFFSAYREFIVEQAAFAEKHNVEIFSVGTELDDTGPFDSQWREIIANIREVYHGKLTYQANTNDTPRGRIGWEWDITWWDDLDYIGANFYVYLNVHAKSNDPTVTELKELYRPFFTKLESLSQKYEKPVIITEGDGMSVDGFTYVNVNKEIDPYLCESRLSVDVQEEADYTQAIFELTMETRYIDGIFWYGWQYTTEETWSQDPCWPEVGFIHKPVERLLRSWYGTK